MITFWETEQNTLEISVIISIQNLKIGKKSLYWCKKVEISHSYVCKLDFFFFAHSTKSDKILQHIVYKTDSNFLMLWKKKEEKKISR